MTEPETETDYKGPERRRWPRPAGRIVLPRWALGVGLAIAYLAIMVPLAFILIYGHRADARAERASRTACQESIALGDLANAFDRTINLLAPGPTRSTAESNLRAPISRAQATSNENRGCGTDGK